MASFKFEEVIDRACERKQLDKEMMKSISDFIFSETKKEMHLFRNLRIYLEGLMIFFYGKTRLEAIKDRIKSGYQVALLANKSSQEKEDVKAKIDNLLEVYPVYIEDKRKTKTAFKESKRINNESPKEV
jgi:hypothetical protein